MHRRQRLEERPSGRLWEIWSVTSTKKNQQNLVKYKIIKKKDKDQSFLPTLWVTSAIDFSLALLYLIKAVPHYSFYTSQGLDI